MRWAGAVVVCSGLAGCSLTVDWGALTAGASADDAGPGAAASAHEAGSPEGGAGPSDATTDGTDAGVATCTASGQRIHGGVAFNATPGGGETVSPCTGQCNTGHSLTIFAGPSREALEHIAIINDTDSLKEYVAHVSGTGAIRVIAVCREPWSEARDDMEIDAIVGICN